MGQIPNDEPGSPRTRLHTRDLELTKAVLGGSVPAWHEFIDRYSGLIFGVLRRHLFSEDDDDLRGVYVDILAALHDGGLASFEGRSTLATWIIVFSRNRARDFLRKRHGRNRPPRWQDRLDDLHRELIRLYFVERLPLDAVLHQIRLAGHDPGRDEVVDALVELSETIPDRFLLRLGAGPLRHEDLEACSQALMHRLCRLSEEAGEGSATPEARLVAAEEEVRLQRLRAATAKLSRQEQRALHLRFQRGWTAPRIAREMRLDGPRRVYSILERGLGKLRKAFRLGDQEP